MNAERLLGSILGGALGVRRKRHRRASRYLTGGGRSFLSTSALVTLAGLAWGAFETARSRPSTGGGGAAPRADETMAAGPPPGTPSSGGIERLVALSVSAARADGELGEEEYAGILAHARAHGVEAMVAAELERARPLPEIVAGISDPKLKSDVYVLAFTIVRADEDVTGAERIYLAQLAHHLGLDAAAVARLERETSARIDAVDAG